MVVQTTQDMTYVLADINNRVRTLEGKYNLFGEHLLVINQNMIEEYKKILKEMKTIDAEMQKMKVDMMEVKSTVKSIVVEMDLFAKKDQVKVLEKYLDLWSPLHFVTEEQLNQAIEQKMKNGKEHAAVN
ncbi:MAG: hypothetical protein AABX72_01675 [Nanoarchaeota archaeon]